jgi:hypothetical protein
MLLQNGFSVSRVKRLLLHPNTAGMRDRHLSEIRRLGKVYHSYELADFPALGDVIEVSHTNACRRRCCSIVGCWAKVEILSKYGPRMIKMARVRGVYIATPSPKTSRRRKIRTVFLCCVVVLSRFFNFQWLVVLDKPTALRETALNTLGQEPSNGGSAPRL